MQTVVLAPIDKTVCRFLTIASIPARVMSLNNILRCSNSQLLVRISVYDFVVYILYRQVSTQCSQDTVNRVHTNETVIMFLSLLHGQVVELSFLRRRFCESFRQGLVTGRTPSDTRGVGVMHLTY